MNLICAICGRSGADALCIKCGRIVCIRCFYGYGELCINCAPRKPMETHSTVKSFSSLRITGILILLFGVLVTTLTLFVESVKGEELGGALPHLLGNVRVETWLLLIVFCLGISLIWSQRAWHQVYQRLLMVEGGRPPTGTYKPTQKSKMLEQIITIELPDYLKKTLYIEEDRNTIIVKSHADKSFNRRYEMPEGFDLNGFKHDYEGNYLLLMLKLKQSI